MQLMISPKHFYTFRYHKTESALCKLESKYIFNKEEQNRVLISNTKVDPSHSAFIKGRVDLIAVSEDYPSLLVAIKKEQIAIDGFKIEYIVLEGDTTVYGQRLDKLRDVGHCIEGDPDYHNPSLTYILSHYNGKWYFGSSTKNNFEWEKHKQKPCSYSNSITSPIAKALINIASGTKKEKKILDACCGAGTIMLEACFAGYSIEGCDINWKLCRDARENLAFFHYNANVLRTDVAELTNNYDAAIVDLPYNLSSQTTDAELLHIMKSVATVTDFIVVVSIADIADMLKSVGLRITDTCSVSKKGKYFSRRIWVCVKEDSEEV